MVIAILLGILLLPLLLIFIILIINKNSNNNTIFYHNNTSIIYNNICHCDNCVRACVELWSAIVMTTITADEW